MPHLPLATIGALSAGEHLTLSAVLSHRIANVYGHLQDREIVQLSALDRTPLMVDGRTVVVIVVPTTD